jgi:hypothetical protein
MSDFVRPPLKDMLASIPGVFGIRLEEEPRYEVVETIGDVEIRRYAPARLAQVTVSGSHEQAINEGFTRLAGYIYGANQANEIMAMTSPVYQEATRGEHPMVSPISQRVGGDGWTIAFFLSNDLEAPPEPLPNDSSITLVEQPTMLLGSVRYSGNNDGRRREEAKQILIDTLAAQSRWRMIDQVSWAQYDQPFAIPFLKRNEAHVALEDVS